MSLQFLEYGSFFKDTSLEKEEEESEKEDDIDNMYYTINNTEINLIFYYVINLWIKPKKNIEYIIYTLWKIHLITNKNLIEIAYFINKHYKHLDELPIMFHKYLQTPL